MPQDVRRSALLAAALWLALAGSVWSGSGRGHLDNPMLPEDCGSCHVGHGLSNEPMLEAVEEEACFQCHGSGEKASRMKAVGKLAPQAEPAQIERQLDKPYRHPVERRGDHRPDEQLPLAAGESASRHAECVDCHSPHSRQNATGRLGVPGFTLTGTRVIEATSELEVCLKCHSEERVTDGRQRNLRLLMGPTARSSHPVGVAPTGPVAPSLAAGAAANRLIRCSDCHGNDDPDGPRGPHGSSYPGLLVDNYDRSPDTEETPFAYALCYRCHSRQSIFDNESFPLHREHIQGDVTRGLPGTSCATCHNPHGSLEASHLISFNQEVVSPEMTGRILFVDHGERKGECYLMCHGKSHSPARY